MDQTASELKDKAQAADHPNGTEEPEELREEIEQTRTEMSDTIDAIQERLSPEHLKEQAMGAVRDATIGRAQTMVDDMTYSAKVKGGSFLDTIRENPLPAAMAAIGIGLLWKNRSHHQVETRGSRDGQSTYGYSGAMAYGAPQASGWYRPTDSRGYGSSSAPAAYDRYGYIGAAGSQQESGGVQERVGEMAGTVQEKAGQAVGQVTQLGSQAAGQVSNLGSHASQLGSQAAGQVSQAVSQAGQYGSQAVGAVSSWPGEGVDAVRNRYDKMILESPLALGLIAFGVGAAVGLVVPETEREHQLMGEKKDQLVERAGEMAQETLGKVQEVAAQTGEAVQQAVQEQTSTTG